MDHFVSIYYDATGDKKPDPKNVHLRDNDEYSGEEIELNKDTALILTVLRQSPGIQIILGKVAQAGYRLGWKKALESQKPEVIETT